MSSPLILQSVDHVPIQVRLSMDCERGQLLSALDVVPGVAQSVEICGHQCLVTIKGHYHKVLRHLRRRMRHFSVAHGAGPLRVVYLLLPECFHQLGHYDEVLRDIRRSMGVTVMVSDETFSGSDERLAYVRGFADDLVLLVLHLALATRSVEVLEPLCASFADLVVEH